MAILLPAVVLMLVVLDTRGIQTPLALPLCFLLLSAWSGLAAVVMVSSYPAQAMEMGRHHLHSPSPLPPPSLGVVLELAVLTGQEGRCHSLVEGKEKEMRVEMIAVRMTVH